MLRCRSVLALALGLALVGPGAAGAGQSHGGGGGREGGGPMGDHSGSRQEPFGSADSPSGANPGPTGIQLGINSRRSIVGSPKPAPGDPELEALYALELRHLTGKYDLQVQPNHGRSDSPTKPFLMPIEDIFNVGGRGVVTPPRRSGLVIPPAKPSYDWSPGLEWRWRPYSSQGSPSYGEQF